MDYNKFYIAFGKLLYSVAISDGKIQEEEYAELLKILQSEMIAIQKNIGDRDGTNVIFTEFEFDEQAITEQDTNSAFNGFASFYNENKNSFSSELKESCKSAVVRIADAYNGIVSQEQAIIDRLKEVFEN